MFLLRISCIADDGNYDFSGEFKDNSKDFFETFGPVFERNSRWSVKRVGAKMGTMESTRNEVDKFYKFWYDFDSWREYSYLDEEDKGSFYFNYNYKS